MARIQVGRDLLEHMLRQHGEEALAAQSASFSDDELLKIQTLGAYYAFSEDAAALDSRGSMGGARALSFATIDVIEQNGRPLRSYCADDPAKGPDALDALRDAELRARAFRGRPSGPAS